MRRVWSGLAIAIALAAMTAGGVVITQGGGGTANTANLWVDTNGGTCTRNSSPAAYSDAAACSTLNAAYAVASFGDTVLATCASGTSCSFPSQQILEDADLAGTSDQSDVVFDIADGMTILWAGIDLGDEGALSDEDGPDNLTLRDFVAIPADGTDDCTISGWNDSYYVTLDNVDICSFWFDGTHNVTVKDSEIHDCDAAVDQPGGRNCHPSVTGQAGGRETTNVLLQGNDFHDIFRSGAAHSECFRTTSVDGITIRGNTFNHCTVYDVAMYSQDEGTLPVTNVLIENNFFGRPLAQGSTFATNQNGLAVGDNYPGGPNCGGSCAPLTNVTVRFNVYADGSTGAYLDVGGGQGEHYVNVKEYGNVGPTSCQSYPLAGSGYSSTYNVTPSGFSCTGTGNVTATLSDVIVNATNDSEDFHLKGSAGTTAADDLVPTGTPGCPGSDYAGTARPQDTNCDAGAYERNTP